MLKKSDIYEKDMRVLVLGNNGMLSSTLYYYLQFKGINVYHTQRYDRSKPLYLNVKEQYNKIYYLDNIPFSFDYIINCIGITRVINNSIEDLKLQYYINAVFPTILQEYYFDKSVNIIHMSTDGVFAGDNGPYYENHPCDASDIYSTSKILGEVRASNVLNIRCSIIGIEKKNNHSLLNWFLSKEDGETVEGYTNHIWNGVTTLQLSYFIYDILSKNAFNTIRFSTYVLHYSPNLPLSKYELLNLINRIFKRRITVIPSKSSIDIDRTLNSHFCHFYMKGSENKKTIEEEIVKLKEFIIK